MIWPAAGNRFPAYPMKIMRIIARLNVGGPARHVVWLTDALRGDEFETTLIAGSVPAGEDDMAYFAEEHGVRPVYIAEMSREISRSDLSSLLKIYRQIKAEKPDIIHTHTAKAGTLGRIAGAMYRWLTWKTFVGRPRRVRMVHTFHGHVFHSYYSPAKTRIFLVIEKVLARFTDRIIAISGQQLEEINTEFRVGRREQFEVIPLGIDVDRFGTDSDPRQRVREEIGASTGDMIVGFVGRLTEIKNLSLLLGAAAVDVDPKLKFAIVGDGHMRDELETKAEILGITGKLTFLGNRTDIADIYSGLDIVALTSLNEGTPLSLIEGMAAGKAVISTGVGGVRDLLGDEIERRDGFSICERGIRVETFNPRDFSAGLDYLSDNENIRSELGRRGGEYIRANYSKQRLIEDIKRLYRELHNA